ncbi:MAG: hypothetical protein HY331_01385 [Chloroflexi bacterium]|nr:hypothetical protein [Chloroflexota bacterium]
MDRNHLDDIRERLRSLDWSKGLTRLEMHRQWPDMPPALLDALPFDYRFADPGSVMSYVEAVLRTGRIDSVPGEPPTGYGESPLFGMHTVFPPEHGVGSGLDSGYTGGGSAQTGSTRDGTTYGAPEENTPFGAFEESRRPDEEGD